MDKLEFGRQLEYQEIMQARGLVQTLPMHAVMKWMGLILQCGEPVNDLIKGASRGIKFTAIEVLHPINPKKQSFLEDLFVHVLPDMIDYTGLKHRLQQLAKANSPDSLSSIESTG